MATPHDEGIQLLQELEAHSGSLRLDLGSASVNHGDQQWTNRAFGDWAEPLKDQVAEIRISMFGGPILRRLLEATRVLAPKECAALTSVPIGWTSIPILNACAVRRDRATAIALNVRLSTALAAANAINWDLQEAVVQGDTASASRAFARLANLLAHSSDRDFDNTLAETTPYPTRFHNWWASTCSLLQLLFVVLHEVAHVALGHLDQVDCWVGHPLSDSRVQFFASSAEMEFEADAFAASKLFDVQKWETAGGLVELLRFSKERNHLAPLVLIELLVWFHIVAPMNMHDYYKIPRSHPHPIDRAQRIVDALKQSDPRLDAGRMQDVLGRYRRLLQLEP